MYKENLINLIFLLWKINYFDCVGKAKDIKGKTDEAVVSETKLKGPFTEHFSKWIESNEYAKYDFASSTLGPNASYGGKANAEQRIIKRPIVFIHGNSDGALSDGAEEWAQGWSVNIEHFQSRGYTSAELYAVTYGDRLLTNASTRSVTCPILLRLRRFVEAVLMYTDAEQIDIIAHSMGVTLARKVVQGGFAQTSATAAPFLDENSLRREGAKSDSKCHLGNCIQHRLHTLIGIAGANYGLCLCAEPAVRNSPACDKNTGFWTHSDACSMTTRETKKPQCDKKRTELECQNLGGQQYASVLQELNESNKGKDANFVVSMWSNDDAILGPNNLALGRHTSLIPHSDNITVYTTHSHYSIKWMTVDDQLAFIGT